MKEKRTTIHLALDLEETLRKEAAKKGVSFKHVVNEYLRLGMEMRKNKKLKNKKFEVKAQDMGAKDNLNFDNIGELMEQLEGPEHK